MEIIYSQKAKNDLIKINWKKRSEIIKSLRHTTKSNFNKLYKQLGETEYHRLDLQNYVAISRIEQNKINILTVVEKKEIIVPE